MTAFDFVALAILGVALTGAVIGFSNPKSFMAAAGGASMPADLALMGQDETRSAGTLFGGDKDNQGSEPAVASFPRGF
ncbi:hypothetical protein [Roseixanthobacter glucoisosaccharinicivorans]|uniref:hypothetical protein n=1 Tax=Roseixanthobacter glucoisosaccharinicivorans TaxID=3119923 RepID=UPI0037281891